MSCILGLSIMRNKTKKVPAKFWEVVYSAFCTGFCIHFEAAFITTLKAVSIDSLERESNPKLQVGKPVIKRG